MLVILAMITFYISNVYATCWTKKGFKVDYASDKCDYWSNSGTWRMKCPEKGNDGTCGMRMSSTEKVGKGTFSASMKAAPGAGMNTAYYLYSWGRFNDKSYAWNEIDIEILGNQISGGKTKIWTNVWTGYYVQHYQLVTVPWDASTGYHTYKIKIDGSKIYWIFDGKTYRTFTYTGYSDLKSTINNNNFQVLMALWSQSYVGWTEMGSVWANNNNFPLYGYFKSVSYPDQPSSFTYEDDTDGGLTSTAIAAVVICVICVICALIAGVIYLRKRRKRLNGDGASFKQEEIEDSKEDSKEAAVNDTASGGYDMEPINAETEIQVEAEVETQA